MNQLNNLIKNPRTDASLSLSAAASFLDTEDELQVVRVFQATARGSGSTKIAEAQEL